LGPTIGNSIATPHVKSAPVIGKFGGVIDSILRHLQLFIVRTVGGDEFPGMIGR